MKGMEWEKGTLQERGKEGSERVPEGGSEWHTHGNKMGGRAGNDGERVR